MPQQTTKETKSARIPRPLALIARSALLLFGLSVAFFAIAHTTPGGMCSLYPNQTVASCQASLGFSSPAPVQYVRWVGTYLHGDLGRSPNGAAVASQILGGIPESLLQILGGLFVYLVALAVAAQLRGRSWVRPFRRLRPGVAVAAMSLPVVWLSLVIGYLFAVHWQLLPSGRVDDPNIPAFWSDSWFSLLPHSPSMMIVNLIKHLVLPSVALGFVILVADRTFAVTVTGVRYPGERSHGRALVLSTFRAARVRAIGTLPAFTSVLMTTLIVVEAVYSYGGLGSHLYAALGSSPADYAMAIDITMLASFVLVLCKLAADLLADAENQSAREEATVSTIAELRTQEA